MRYTYFRFACLFIVAVLLSSWPVAVAAPADDDLSPRTGGEITATDRQYWAYQPVSRPDLPSLTDTSWPRSPIDCFVLARLESRQLSPVAPADCRALLRRVTFDLTGLPPTPADIDAFVRDQSPDAVSRVLDRLLSSPRYGERWARHWLDVARYGEDIRPDNFMHAELPMAYRYRDWVIRALNEDLPYDRFVMMQVAGDRMPETGFDGHLAMGLLTLGPVYGSDGGNPESIALAVAETLDDKVDVIARGILGLTVACARCHDHKFDPIPTHDYYSLAGAMHNTNFDYAAPLVCEEVVAKYHEVWDKIAALEKRIEEVEKQETDSEMLKQLKSERADLLANAPNEYPTTHSAKDRSSDDMVVAVGGNPTKSGPTVPRRMLRIVAGDDPQPFTQGSGRRELATALASRDNPLFSRVIVNRLWQHHFGRGIVSTPDNFGRLGARPTHPQLLDWLADQLVHNGWSIKSMHRRIMLSATYQLSSRNAEANARVDGNNHLLWRMNRRRLDVESWRDATLAVAGTLNGAMGGRSQPDLFSSRRRTIYGRISRNSSTATDKFLRLFDFPDANISNSQRTETTVPQQQLFVMNNPFVLAQANALARRLMEFTDDRQLRIRRAFAVAYGRVPSAEELQLAQRFLDSPGSVNGDGPTKWDQYVHILLASSEFMYLE